MVFSGKLSKSCLRCRNRRLKCDFQTPSCSQCMRASTECAGYRDANQIRIRDESSRIQRKAMIQSGVVSPEPRTLHLSLQSQARDVFFFHYVSGVRNSWDFLLPFYCPNDAPDYLAQSIDAIALAFLSSQVYSDAALSAAREKYVTALRSTHKAIRCPKTAVGEATILSTMLLDLFEKITNNEFKDVDSWANHINGAFALAKLRGLDIYERCYDVGLRILGRLSNNLLISCIANATRAPEELYQMLEYTGRLSQSNNPKWRLTNLMVKYASIRSISENNHEPAENLVSQCLELDNDLLVLSLCMPATWQPTTTSVDYDSERIYGRYRDSYADRHVTQTWNVLRLVRILLNEAANARNEDAGRHLKETYKLQEAARAAIHTMTADICASAPQYLDCELADKRHMHTPSQNLDCYTLIFPLYVAAWSQHTPDSLKSWIIEQLHYMGSHFGIRNAESVGQILDRGDRIDPWAVYAMLGSYAFVA